MEAFAGGTDLMVLLEAGALSHLHYINLWQLEELRGIEVGEHHVTLGALTTYTEVIPIPIAERVSALLAWQVKQGLAPESRNTWR
jgi:CO/xanthine dehydrogenase FAD-binding subunit